MVLGSCAAGTEGPALFPTARGGCLERRRGYLPEPHRTG